MVMKTIFYPVSMPEMMKLFLLLRNENKGDMMLSKNERTTCYKSKFLLKKGLKPLDDNIMNISKDRPQESAIHQFTEILGVKVSSDGEFT